MPGSSPCSSPDPNTMKLGVHRASARAVFVGGRRRLVPERPRPRVGSAVGPRAARRARTFRRQTVDALALALAAEARPGDQILVMSNGGFGGLHAQGARGACGRTTRPDQRHCGVSADRDMMPTPLVPSRSSCFFRTDRCRCASSRPAITTWCAVACARGRGVRCGRDPRGTARSGRQTPISTTWGRLAEITDFHQLGGRPVGTFLRRAAAISKSSARSRQADGLHLGELEWLNRSSLSVPVPARHERLSRLLGAVLPQLGEVYVNFRDAARRCGLGGAPARGDIAHTGRRQAALLGNGRSHRASGRACLPSRRWRHWRRRPARPGRPGSPGSPVCRRPSRTRRAPMRARVSQSASSDRRAPGKHPIAEKAVERCPPRPTRARRTPLPSTPAACAAPPPSPHAAPSETAMLPVSTRVRGSSTRLTASHASEGVEHQRRRAEGRKRAGDEIETRGPMQFARPGCAPWRKNAGPRTAAR